MGNKLKITLLKSPIGRPESHKRTLKALGLRRLNQTVVKEDNPSLRGMIQKVDYLLKVENVE
ncbi:MAG: large subunit ribosomal protein [Candidatus Atribacteria bacterium]|jgi:large subunit ribosomal protein L30|uniref:50S ribosomal protein L30 n=1 Tax=Thermatribacter velox TaxID=3039681 RepID=A0ABZ2YFR3_9BACT|nr:large subunit ribosomal protein [Candidatus Atribacteria bacterium]MDI3530747.1 large subunit ribosomal protein [Candidatus Atribacteria bacterium]